MKRALYSGSFDPMTNGHLDIIKRSSQIFDEVVVGIISNPQKMPLFTVEERVAMIEETVKELGNVKVETFSGLLASYVNEKKYDAVIRGIRTAADFEYELQMAHMNAKLFNPGIESIFLMTSPEYSFVSSSLVKEVVSLNGDVEGLIPPVVLDNIKKKF